MHSKTMKKLLSLLTVVSMLFGNLIFFVTAEQQWNVENDILTVDASGAMQDYGPANILGNDENRNVITDYTNTCDSNSNSVFLLAADPMDSSNKVWKYTGGNVWSYAVDYSVIQTAVEYTVTMRYYMPVLPEGGAVDVAYYYGDGWKKVTTLTKATEQWQELTYTITSSKVGSVYRFIQLSGVESGVELYLDDVSITHEVGKATLDYETACNSVFGSTFSLSTDPLDSSNSVWCYTGGDCWSYILDYNTIALNTVYTVSFRYYLPTITAGTEIKIGHYYSDWQCAATLTAETDGWQEMRYTFSASTNSGVYRFIEVLGAATGTVNLYLDDFTVSHSSGGSQEDTQAFTATYVDYSTDCNKAEPYYFSWTNDPDDETNKVLKYTLYDQYDSNIMGVVVGAEDGVRYTVSMRYKITDMGDASVIHLSYHMGGSMNTVGSFYQITDGWQDFSYSFTYDADSSTKRFIELYAKTASGANTGNCNFYFDNIRISHEKSYTEEDVAPWEAEEYSQVVLAEGITTVGAYAFCADTLEQITIPSSVTTIRYGAFDPEGVTVYYNGTETQWKQVLCEMDMTGAQVVCTVAENAAGDTNSDGTVDVLDLIRAKKIEWGVAENADKAEVTAADMDCSNQVTDYDTNLLRQYLILNGILPAGPQSGTNVKLTNELVEKALMNYTPGNIELYRTGSDEYAMNPVCLRWFANTEDTLYTVKVSTTPDFEDAQTFTIDKTQLSLQNLMPVTTYYWKVAAGDSESTVSSFTTDAVPMRTIHIPEGVSNTRDLGGKVTADGSGIPYGMVYRGGNLDRISEVETVRAMVEYLGIKTDLDLRANEVSLQHSPLGNAVNYYLYRCSRYANDSHGLEDDDNYRAGMVEAIRQFANADNYPIYVHCAIGRDRTGTICLLIEALLGVEEKDIYMDYEFSLLSVSGTMDASKGSDLLNYFTKTINYLKTFSKSGDLQEGTENYLLSIGITQNEIDTIRNLLLVRGD